MSKIETRAETTKNDVSVASERSVSRYPGRDPVTVMTTRLPGVEPSREERMRAGLRRLRYDGRVTLRG